jgi:plastocyanin
VIPQDLTEPPWNRRVPATVIWTAPGERLRVHVLNSDTDPHSLHVHGLAYGIDSDGSWPFGVAASNDRRSDAICPGERWCYVFDVTDETVGAWPFHDHVVEIEASANRGLFGGIVVRDPEGPKPDIEVPFFFHRMVGSGGNPIFDSGTLTGGKTFTHTFATAGTYDYVCRLHPMNGIVRVVPAGAASAAVAIVDAPTPAFTPTEVTIGPGGVVTWTHAGTMPHTVSDAQTSPLDTFAINGRAYVGNTPIVLASAGQRIRWYVFDLDLSERWHNSHTHGQRFRVGHELMDTRSLGPAESFVVDTIAPPVLLDPSVCDPGLGNGRKRRFCLCGDFLVHCHVEMHMMTGMVAVVRSIQDVSLTEAEVESIGYKLPIADEWYCR